METQQTSEPKFFLQDELILFLQKNAVLTVIPVSTNDNIVIIQTCLSICGKSVTTFEAPLILKNDATEIRIRDNSDDIKNLIAHLMDQQKRIESLELALKQYDK